MKLDPNKDLPEVPEEVRSMIRNNLSPAKIDLVQQIACYDLGFYNIKNEDSICKAFNITIKQLDEFRKNNRDRIEEYKDKHKQSKLKLSNAISDRMLYADVYAKSVLSGEDEMATKMKQVLINLEKILPMRQLQDISEIIKDMDENPRPVDGGSPTQVNVYNTSPAMEAQKRFEEKMNAKVIEEKKE